MNAESLLASIGDDAVLNCELNETLREVWIDRDLSWLDFNDRVLAEALDDRTPLLERAKFLAIVTSNTDEYFMKRISVLREKRHPQGAALIGGLRRKIEETSARQETCWRDVLVPALQGHGIHIRACDDLTAAQRQQADRYFQTQVSAALTPLTIHPGEHFPFLSNLSMSLVFTLEDPDHEQLLYARVKVPAGLRNWILLDAGKPGDIVCVRLHEIIQANLPKLYPGMRLGPPALVRLTRDAEVEAPVHEVTDVVKEVQRQIEQRRFEPVVRLEFTGNLDPAIRQLLMSHFELSETDLYEAPDGFDCSTLFEIAALDAPALKYAPWTPVVPYAVNQSGDLFSLIREGDLLVHHPYESFDATVEQFIDQAASDAQVLAIKMTVYRVGDDTPFVASLIRAAQAGKQVACIIELKARFDEARNVHWAAALEKAGAHVTFGITGLKIHGKTALVVRKEPDGLRAYAHIGTGNYHARTARLYADLGLFTCDAGITSDVVALFHYLTGHSHPPEFSDLLVAPKAMRPGFLKLIEREIAHKKAGRPARIVAKMNQLEDPEIIEALCRASTAGVSVDLIVRGFCCLRPGVHGFSENVRVYSVIGRFLEHSRIYYFANGSEEMTAGDFYIGSADWMHRNLSRRIEVATPLKAAASKARAAEILQICLNDRRQGWILESNGEYRRRADTGNGDADTDPGTHQTLMQLALQEQG